MTIAMTNPATGLVEQIVTAASAQKRSE